MEKLDKVLLRRQRYKMSTGDYVIAYAAGISAVVVTYVAASSDSVDFIIHALVRSLVKLAA